MRIEKFLFEQNIEPSQAEALISQYPNLTYNSTQEFIDFFESQGVKLAKNISTKMKEEVYPPKYELLQRMKDFKSSTDYDYVKKYIEEQKRIQVAIDTGRVIDSRNLLDSINSRQVDPFFNFVVRKILTGSETGVLPSENLQTLLDELTKRQQQDIDTETDVTRDDTGRIISFDNYLRNKGSVRANLLDERFSLDTFNYVVDRSFNRIPEAVDAQQNILQNIDEFSKLFPEDGDEQKLIENLKQLINQDADNRIAMQAKIASLEQKLESTNALVGSKNESIENILNIVEELSIQKSFADAETEVYSELVDELTLQIDTTLTDLEGKVSDQLTNTADAFDALSTQLQANSEKQLAAFEKAVSGIADALTPKEPEPEPDNPAGDIIKQILDKWENVTAITDKSYKAFDDIMNDAGVKNKPSKSSYVFAPRADNNAYNPSDEIKQHLKWNNEIKQQMKQTFTNITDEGKAKKIVANIDLILKDAEGSLNNKALQDTIKDSFTSWANDRGRVRGGGADVIRRVGLELGVTADETFTYGSKKQTWKNINWGDWGSTVDTVKSEAVGLANFLKTKVPTGAQQLISILTILDEIKQSGSGIGW